MPVKLVGIIHKLNNYKDNIRDIDISRIKLVRAILTRAGLCLEDLNIKLDNRYLDIFRNTTKSNKTKSNKNSKRDKINKNKKIKISKKEEQLRLKSEEIGKTRTEIMIDRAKSMRENPTKHEKLFSNGLEQLKIKYLSQEVLNNTYILDFIVDDKVVVEIDGDSHNSKKAKRKDAIRTDFINRILKLPLVRFTNDEISRDVKNCIKNLCCDFSISYNKEEDSISVKNPIKA